MVDSQRVIVFGGSETRFTPAHPENGMAMRHGLIIGRLEPQAHPPSPQYNWPVSYCSQRLKCASQSYSS